MHAHVSAMHRTTWQNCLRHLSSTLAMHMAKWLTAVHITGITRDSLE